MKPIMKIVIVAIGVLVTGVLLSLKYLNPPKQDASLITISADHLFSAYEKDEKYAADKFNNHLLEVTGTVKSVNIERNGETSITLLVHAQKFGVICWIDNHIGNEISYSIGDEIKLMGNCKGMMMDVIVTDCMPSSE